ncbi:MAG: TRAP transporter permease [Anaerotruncus sp.]|nr:TRAP transporter permease [Anaerotruncus sp.]
MRKLKGPMLYIVFAIGILISLFSLYTATFGVRAPFIQRGVHLACLLPMAFLLYPATKKSPIDRFTAFDVCWAVASVLPCIYVIINRVTLEGRMVFVTKVKGIEIALGLILIVVVIEALRRAVTGVMSIMVVLALSYLYLGPYLPGMLNHKGLALPRLVESVCLLSGEGIFGSLMGTSATYIIVFIIFGAVAMETGAGEFFTDFSRALAGSTRGGPAKIATLSSALFGTLTGSAVANVYTTGSFTIPLMKKNGFPAHFAGAVEAAASTGGQLMPPVMGAAAFVMAENLDMPYVKLAMCATIVAVLYYLSIMMMIHFRCLKEDIKGEPKEELPNWKDVGKKCYLFLPVVLLFYMLLNGYSTLLAGVTSIAASILISYLKKETRMTPKKILHALYSGAQSSIMVAVALAGAGIIVVAVTYTGLALSFSSIVIAFSGGIKFIALILIAISCIILGMGVPSTAAYVIASALGARVMIKLGVEPIAAHMFVFYFSIISNITPPVAVAAYAGANLAKSEPMKTGFTASAIAAVGYIVPFIVAYDPVLLLQGTPLQIVQSTITATFGVCILAAGVQGYFIGILNPVKRCCLGAAALLLIFPGTFTDLIAIGLFLAVLITQWMSWKNRSKMLPV